MNLKTLCLIICTLLVHSAAFPAAAYENLCDKSQSSQQKRAGFYDPEATSLFLLGLKAVELSCNPHLEEFEKEITKTNLKEMGANLITCAGYEHNNPHAQYALWYFNFRRILQCPELALIYKQSYKSPSIDTAFMLIDYVQKIKTRIKTNTPEITDKEDLQGTIKLIMKTHKTLVPGKQKKP